MDKITEKYLDFDALLEAEKVTGKSYKEDSATQNLGLLLHVQASRAKRNHLKSRNDTYYSIHWAEFKTICSQNGFTTLLQDNFVGEGGKYEDEFFIAHRGGIVLKAESFQGVHTNSATVYFNAKANGDDKSYCPKHFSGHQIYIGQYPDARGFAPSGAALDQFVYVGYLSGLEGIISNLDDLEDHCQILLPWIESPFMYLLTYQESRDIQKCESEGRDDESYRGITAERYCRAGLDKILGIDLETKFFNKKGKEE